MEKEFQCPYLINLDDDPYANKRYVYAKSTNQPVRFRKDIEPIVHQGLEKSFCTIRVNKKMIQTKERVGKKSQRCI